jgi:transposase
MESRVELFALIRRDARVEGLSVRALAARHKVHRRTVRQALESASPPERKPRQGVSWRLEPFKTAIDAMLVEDTTAPRKQRHTARRILARLIEEHGAEELSYSTVRDYVRVRRAQVDVEAGRRVEVFVPQEHAPGAEAEVDFGEVWVVLNGVKTKCHMFVFRLSHSGKAIHRIYPTQAQEAFLEGHIEAFQVLGGIPTKHIRYDNLTSAVTAVVFGQGRQRLENDRWVLFRSHYGFDPFYCQPGIAGAHEKGGVEGEVGWFRRNRLSPMPVTESLDELNDRIRVWEAQDNARRINDRIRTIGQDFAAEQASLGQLPGEVFDPGLALSPRVDRSSMITVRMVKYSVPARFIGRKSGCPCGPPRSWCSTAVPWPPGIRGLLPNMGSPSSWITTWRSSRPSPARCPVLRLWPGRGSPGRLPARMRRSGPPPGASTETPTGRVNLSTSCCSTDPWTPDPSRPGSLRPWE